MKTTEQWLEEKIEDYNENPDEALKDRLLSTIILIEQYVKSPSRTTKSMLDSCLHHNKLFLKEIGVEWWQ